MTKQDKDQLVLFISLLDVCKMQGYIENYRVVDSDKQIIEIQPFFSIRPLWKISLDIVTDID